MSLTSPASHVRELNRAWTTYMLALKNVLDLGPAAVRPLIEELSSKPRHPAPFLKAIGLLMYTQEAEAAIPLLLDLLVEQSPYNNEAVEALVRAGSKVVPDLLRYIERAGRDADEATLNAFIGLGVRYLGETRGLIANSIARLLDAKSDDIRETAAQGLQYFGLPAAQSAVAKLESVAEKDPSPGVRAAAVDTLTQLRHG